MRTHIADYGADAHDPEEQIYEPPLRILGVEVIGEQGFLMFFDHVDGPDADTAHVDSRYVQAIVRPDTLLRALRLHTAAAHVRTSRIPALGDEDSCEMPARQVLLITVIGDDAYLDLHTADPDLGRPIYPPLGSIRVPALDLTETLAVQIENDQALAV